MKKIVFLAMVMVLCVALSGCAHYKQCNQPVNVTNEEINVVGGHGKISNANDSQLLQFHQVFIPLAETSGELAQDLVNTANENGDRLEIDVGKRIVYQGNGQPRKQENGKSDNGKKPDPTLQEKTTASITWENKTNDNLLFRICTDQGCNTVIEHDGLKKKISGIKGIGTLYELNSMAKAPIPGLPLGTYYFQFFNQAEVAKLLNDGKQLIPTDKNSQTVQIDLQGDISYSVDP